MGKKPSPLADLVKEIKGEEKAAQTASGVLKKIIEDYGVSGKFEKYYEAHAADAAKYLIPHQGERPGRFRASSAGKCLQQQAYNVVLHDILHKMDEEQRQHFLALLPENAIKRPPQQYHALFNGTYAHVRWHMFFDALHAEGLVDTLAVEQFGYKEEWEVSGSLDRLIAFSFNGREITAIIDYKTIKARYWDRLAEPQTDHKLQQHVYHEWADADLWMMLYENKDTHQLKIFDTPFSELVQRQLRNNYDMMRTWIEQFETNVPRIERLKLPLVTDWCKYCPWRDVCKLEHPDLAQQQATSAGEDDVTEEILF